MPKRGSEGIISNSISFVGDDPTSPSTGGKVARTSTVSNDAQDPRNNITTNNSSSGAAPYSRATWEYSEDILIVDELANEDDNGTEGIDENESSQEEDDAVVAPAQEGFQSTDSQGSTESSIGYLDRIVLDVSNNTEQLHQLMDSPILALPKDREELFRNYVQSAGFKSRFRQLLYNDLSSHLISCGLDLESDSGRALLESVFGDEDDLLFARVGRILVQDFCSVVSSNGAIGYANPYVGESEGVAEVETIRPTFNDGVKMEASSADIPSSSSATAATAVVEVQNAPYSSVPDYRILTEQENTGAIPLLPYQENTEASACSQYMFPGTVLEDGDWERAFDKITNKKNVEKMGQVLFLAVFSQEEIIRCTLSGKKNTEPFCDTKLRFMKKSIAWLLLKPRERTQTAFEKDLRERECELTLTDEDLEILRKNVLSEFAYRQRKQLIKAATANQ